MSGGRSERAGCQYCRIEEFVGYAPGYDCPFEGAIALDPYGLGWAAGHSSRALARPSSSNLRACTRASKATIITHRCRVLLMTPECLAQEKLRTLHTDRKAPLLPYCPVWMQPKWSRKRMSASDFIPGLSGSW